MDWVIGSFDLFSGDLILHLGLPLGTHTTMAHEVGASVFADKLELEQFRLEAEPLVKVLHSLHFEDKGWPTSMSRWLVSEKTY